jgi:thioredoxin 1
MKTFTFRFITAIMAVFPVFSSVSDDSGIPQKIIDNVYHLTDQDFDANIKSGIVLVDFWAVWCGPCRTQGPIVNEIAIEIGQKAKIAKVDVDRARITANRYNVRYIPTIIIFKDGEPVRRMEGLQTKEGLVAAIEEVQ